MQKASVTFRYLTFTARQRSYGKAMFSQVSVHREGGYLLSHVLSGVDISGTRSLLVGGYVHGVGMSMGCVCPAVCTHPRHVTSRRWICSGTVGTYPS